jgi:hypothetical protein
VARKGADGPIGTSTAVGVIDVEPESIISPLWEGRSETSAIAKLSAKDQTMMGISTARPIALAMPM